MASIFSTSFVVALFLLASPLKAFAEDQTVKTSHLDWSNDARANFLNYEWKDQTIEGETFFNSTLKSVLVSKSEIVTVEFGFLGIKRFGDIDRTEQDTAKKAAEAEPWLQIKIQPTSAFQFIVGSIDDDHGAHQALIAEHRKFEDLTEEGFQLRYNSTLINSDFWLNWQRRESQKSAEQFEVGSINKISSTFAEGDLQFLAHHIDGQKTEDTTSLRNNVVMAGGALMLPMRVTPKIGGRFFYSKYRLNDEKELQGRTRQMYSELSLPVDDSKNITAAAAKVSGDNYVSRFGLAPYTLKNYDFAELAYHQKFYKTDGNKIQIGSFGFRARFERFKDKQHTTQEMTVSANF